MEWILAGLAIVVLAAAAIMGSGRWGEMPPVVDDRYPGMVPDGTLTGDDIRDTRFRVVPRGYSMTQVDELLARVSNQLDANQVDRTAPASDTALTTAATTTAAAAPAATPTHTDAAVAEPVDREAASRPGVVEGHLAAAEGEHRSL